jgi:hypothetical protein
MLSAILNWLSPARRRFMRRYGREAASRIRARLEKAGSPRAIAFLSILLDANLEFLAFALSAQGPFAAMEPRATADTVEACLVAMLIFSVNLFARAEFARDQSELIPLLASVAQSTPMQVMVRRDALRKAPRSEEWMLYTWIAAALGGENPSYDGELDRRFSYNYLAYIEQYRSIIERTAARPEA